MKTFTHAALMATALLSVSALAFGQGGQGGRTRHGRGNYNPPIGPASFISGQDFEFVKGDALTIIGSKRRRTDAGGSGPRETQ